MEIILLTLAYLLLLSFKAGSSWIAIRQQARERIAATAASAYVSVLQPILSGDPLLKEKLAWNVASLTDVEFLWLIDERDQTAFMITEEIRREYPHAKIEIIRFEPAPGSVNPKSFKLEHAWQHANGSVCLILDDDSRLFPETFQAMLGYVDEKTIVTALPYYEDQGDLPSRLLATFVNNNAALTYLSLIPYQSPASINGMCYALSRQLLIRIGGYQKILGHLADDLALATHVREHGGEIKQIYQPVAVQTSLDDFTQYCRQAHRWFLFATLLLARQGAAQKSLIFLLHGLPPILLWCLLAIVSIQPAPTVAMLLVGALLLFRALIISILQQMYSGRVRHHPFISILSELLQPLHLFHAIVSRRIIWRTRRLRVFSNERFESI